ncbi:DUF4347 domain-containing protein, partial [Azospirillum sp. B4]|uniref:DUF4347 domain-containing protein n=1 Tax=Azospirillum sp. B4 TaxID=95605 RepID=UPI0005C89F45
MTAAPGFFFTSHSVALDRAARSETGIAVIDTALADWQTLRADLPSGIDTVLIGEGLDGVAVMAQALHGRRGVQAIHVLCHGFEGGLQLGAARLDAGTLPSRAKELAAIGASLAPDGDILLYGCDVAAGHGHEFLDALADITGADIAASRTLTGAADLGGDWDLGWTRGTVHTVSLRIDAYRGVMAVAPAYTSAVGYIGESTFTITFDSPLDASSIPALARFGSSVDVNGTGVTVTGATISGNSVTLTIQASLLPGDIIDFTYSDPPGDDTTGVLQGATGGVDVASFSHSLIVAITRPAPTLQSAAVNGTALVLTYDSALDATNIPATGAFTVSVGGSSVSVTNVAVNSANKTVTLTLAQAAQAGQAVTVSYTDPTSGDDVNAIQSTGGDDAASFSAQSVTNNTVDTTPPAAPVVTSAALTNSATPTITGTAEAGSTVTLTVGGATYTTTATGGTWSINLSTATPTSGSLSLNANGANAVSVTATDAASNTSTAGTQSLVIDTTAPSAPAVTSAALANSATPTIAGTAEAGSTVTVTVGGATYTTTATGGAWSINLSTATPTSGSLSLNANGANAVSATATDAAGNTSTAGTQSLVIDTTAPGAPVVTSA